jgi:hypothetical protein
MKTSRSFDSGVVTYYLSEKDLTGKEYCVIISFTSFEIEEHRNYVINRIRRNRTKIKNKINTINEGIINGCVSGNELHSSVVS